MQGITLASAKAVAAGKSCKQVDVSACANLGRKAVGEMLQTCKAASKVAESDDDRDRYSSERERESKRLCISILEYTMIMAESS